MPAEPLIKRTVAFFDGQNLFNAAKEAFGYGFPNYDPMCLAAALSRRRGWHLQQDLGEAADEVRRISRQQGRWVKIASAFPVSSTTTNKRGVNGTEWIPIERALYDSCIDPRDYRPGP
jgi:hypothetical protein